MRKSYFVSFCGWAFLACQGIALGNAFIYAVSMPHVAPMSDHAVGVAVALSVPCLLVWLFGTIIHRFRAGTAKMRAQAMVDAQQAAARAAAAGPGPQRVAAPPPERTGTR
jgi:hypothetical protein